MLSCLSFRGLLFFTANKSQLFSHPHSHSFSAFTISFNIMWHVALGFGLTALDNIHGHLWLQQASYCCGTTHIAVATTGTTPECHPKHTGIQRRSGCRAGVRCGCQSAPSPPVQSPRASPQWTRRTRLSFPVSADAVAAAEAGAWVAPDSVSRVSHLPMRGSGCTHGSRQVLVSSFWAADIAPPCCPPRLPRVDRCEEQEGAQAGGGGVQQGCGGQHCA